MRISQLIAECCKSLLSAGDPFVRPIKSRTNDTPSSDLITKFEISFLLERIRSGTESNGVRA